MMSEQDTMDGSGAAEFGRQLQSAIGEVIFGAEDVVHALAVALAVRGHVLLQGVPGIGKTMLAKTLAKAIGGSFQRVQGTTDLMPGDITGTHVYEPSSQTFHFHQGPLFADVVLVDEINRASPRTQSALLQAMEERQITADRETFPLPADFFVIATQNPQELEGTFPLPESQLDRFVMRVDMTYPGDIHELRILQEYGFIADASGMDAARQPIDAGHLRALRRQVEATSVSRELLEYLLAIARATRESPGFTFGLSTRGLIALLRCARASAALQGDAYVTPDHVQRMAPLVMNHRLPLSPEALLSGESAALRVQQVVASVPVPR